MSTRAAQKKTWTRLRLAMLIIYTWTMVLLLGGLLVETFMIYPNIFHNAPERFAIALRFMAVTGPAQYFRPFGMASVALGVLTTAVCWPSRAIRWWVLASLVMIGIEGLVSMLYFWPLNRFLFVEGAAVHSTDALRQAAIHFQTWHWARVTLNAASAIFTFVALILAASEKPPGSSSRTAATPTKRT